RQFVHLKVIRPCPGIKFLHAKIDSVRPIRHRRAHAVPVARRCEQFHVLPAYIPLFHLYPPKPSARDGSIKCHTSVILTSRRIERYGCPVNLSIVSNITLSGYKAITSQHGEIKNPYIPNHLPFKPTNKPAIPAS